MRKADVAEKLLSFTTNSERAAGIAGDLSEDAARRGLIWFWCSLMRITSALVWRAWTDTPIRMVGLGVGGFLLCNFLLFALFFAVGLATTIDFLSGKFFLYFGSMWAVSGSYVLTGRWLAHYAPARELPACATFFFINTLFWTLVFMVQPVSVPGIELHEIILDSGGIGFLFLGVEHARWKRSVAS